MVAALARLALACAGALIPPIQAKLKDKMHGIKERARRLSSELGAATRVAALRGAKQKARRRRYIHACGETQSQSEDEDEDSGGDVATAAAAGVAAGTPAGDGGREACDDAPIEKERLHPEEREETKEEEGGGGAPHRRRRASSTACLVS